ncbi:flagellar basal body L-ring protein FlgH [Bythopirellula goksoeyrii]|uniref:Flagellar L-ring protein n=1 Tax=Bythopirellula goksoeyrii TaxID=1400387 RepID=A0A5B9Q974_9BACT|nr:flagellar basal body L-ring protein FlgH [Bythopirellula goksoeyrii]QEG34180.1 Flagellar L-ring protein precursor [Bythopirellula goksoeyrii]
MIHRNLQIAFSFSALFALLAIGMSANWASAQDGSLYLQPSQGRDGLTLEDSSFMYQELPPESLPRQLQLHSIITVIVDVRSRFLSEGDAQNRKTQSLTAVLADWIRLENGSLKPAPQFDGDPRVSGTLNSQYRVQSDVELLDALAFRMAVEIVDIQPNGNLVIEGHQTINNNEEQWRISLSGVVRREAIQADNTVSSDAIYDLSIDKEEMGQVRDAYARGWFTKWYDRYKPF